MDDFLKKCILQSRFTEALALCDTTPDQKARGELYSFAHTEGVIVLGFTQYAYRKSGDLRWLMTSWLLADCAINYIEGSYPLAMSYARELAHCTQSIDYINTLSFYLETPDYRDSNYPANDAWLAYEVLSLLDRVNRPSSKVEIEMLELSEKRAKKFLAKWGDTPEHLPNDRSARFEHMVSVARFPEADVLIDGLPMKRIEEALWSLTEEYGSIVGLGYVRHRAAFESVQGWWSRFFVELAHSEALCEVPGIAPLADFYASTL